MNQSEQFVQRFLEHWLDHCATSVDGGEVQDMLEKCGFIQYAVYDPDVHGSIEDVEPGEDCFVLTDEANRILGRFPVQTNEANDD